VLAAVDDKFWELKESAKWSLDVNERKHAIRQLAESYGPEAIQSIAEIRDISAYDDIKKVCIEAIKAASIRRPGEKTNKSLPKKAKKRKKAKRKK
jgi:hypothetical protein